MSLDSIVSVTITREATAPTAVGFGTPLIMGYHTEYVDRARVYSTLQGLVDDGFATTDPIYRCAQSILAQSPRVEQFVVGRAANAPTQIIEVTPIAVNSTLYRLTINGVNFDYTSDASATVAEITAGLTAAVNGGAEPVTAVDNTTKLTLTSDTAGLLFTLAVNSRARLTQKNTTANPGIVADIQAVQAENNDWYMLHLTSLSEAEILAAAAYIETQVKMMVVSCADDEIATSSSTDVASDLKAANYIRTGILFHPNSMSTYPCAGWAGIILPQNPGKATWMFKTIAGSVATTLTDSEKNYIEGKGANFYTTIAGVTITQDGTASKDNGNYLDLTRDTDFIRSRMQENVYATLVNEPKVPFNNTGIATIGNRVNETLLLASSPVYPIINSDYTLTLPDINDISFADKSNRNLPDITFEATYQGAIHNVVITGTISV